MHCRSLVSWPGVQPAAPGRAFTHLPAETLGWNPLGQPCLVGNYSRLKSLLHCVSELASCLLLCC